MNRRRFLMGSTTLASSVIPFSAFAQQIATCCANLPKLGSLTPLAPISVNLDFIQTYGRKTFPPWQDNHRQRILDAKPHFERVWSSAEFKTAVTSVQEFIWQDSDTMSGTDLYAKLTRTPVKEMRLAAGNKSKRELAISWPDGETLIELHYLNSSGARTSDFVHTLSHEYTHYTAGVESWDQGHSGDVTRYVSYGIGCITQKLAFPAEPCAYEVDTKITGAAPHTPGVAITKYTVRQTIPRR